MLSTITPTGNLTFLLEADELEHIEHMLDRHEGNDGAFLVDMLDYFGFSPNGRLTAINPEDIGALTEAPLVANDIEQLDDGAIRVHGQVWWYPAYERYNFAEVLARDGKVTFTKAH